MSQAFFLYLVPYIVCLPFVPYQILCRPAYDFLSWPTTLLSVFHFSAFYGYIGVWWISYILNNLAVWGYQCHTNFQSPNQIDKCFLWGKYSTVLWSSWSVLCFSNPTMKYKPWLHMEGFSFPRKTEGICTVQYPTVSYRCVLTWNIDWREWNEITLFTL